MNQVLIYTTPACVYCKMAKQYFREKSVEYSEVDVYSDDDKAREMMDKSGQIGVPVIDINGQIIVGFDRPAIDLALSK